MNGQVIAPIDEERARYLVQFETLSRELTTPLPVDRAAEIERTLSLLEDYARRAGLFRPEETLEFRLGRFVARWRLGEALVPMERGTGPGRGKKDVTALTSFRTLLEQIKVDPQSALEAQRVACLPQSELEKFCNRARKDGDAPTFDELIRYARPYWYQASRKAKHQTIRDRAVMNRAVIGPFPLSYSDPPWQFEVYSEKGLERSPDRHYETLPDDEIINLMINGKSVREIFADDGAHFMWCTSSNFHRALKVLEAWDFEFKTSAVWIKDKIGTGYVFRNQHEMLLYGTRGDMPAPQWQPSSVFQYPVSEHSAKPPEIRAVIERMYPDFDAQTRLELFARGDVNGWTTHGFEA